MAIPWFQIWSLPDGVCKLTFHGHQAAVSCLHFNETRIISGALDRLIKIWNLMTGEVGCVWNIIEVIAMSDSYLIACAVYSHY